MVILTHIAQFDIITKINQQCLTTGENKVQETILRAMQQSINMATLMNVFIINET